MKSESCEKPPRNPPPQGPPEPSALEGPGVAPSSGYMKSESCPSLPTRYPRALQDLRSWRALG
eukprot:NODE_7245_length_579_cov_6.233962_g6237_i0.p3 GENE.NODE_7245_length_579_cov_6.233962_g6237_i0~~NODE_7245_length_579_cov_6.233962_g6237_i0.p3  ORF type:complete len:63 (-),score=1.83 NODE_7245_length_579_cov_6.233962_g6237_i0:345-533(-)